MSPYAKTILEKIKAEINATYGFCNSIPRINYGPCGVFAKIFFKKWNAVFNEKVHICFILTMAQDECDRIVIRMPWGELYDGGIGSHTDHQYLHKFTIIAMHEHDEALLEKWSYGLNRTYPRFCPNFNRKKVREIVGTNLDKLFELAGTHLFNQR